MAIKFSNQLKAFAVKARKKETAVLRRSAIDVLGRVTLRSPVDTGRFRANWAVGINEVGVSTAAASTDEGFGNAVGGGQQTIQSAKADDAVIISNNLPYAVRLEEGYSSQAPHGMVGITVAEWPGIVADANEALT